MHVAWHARSQDLSRRKNTSALPNRLQRKCDCGQHTAADEYAERRQKRLSLQRRAANQAETAVAPPIVYDVLRSPGQPLDAATRAFMEPRFGHDFSQVRVHTDARAAESARAVGALAYTVGRDVVFGEGQYAPGTGAGRGLIAHELTHTVQQSLGRQQPAATPMIGASPGDAAEQEAETATRAILQGRPSAPMLREPLKVARRAEGDEQAASLAGAAAGETVADSGLCAPSRPGISPSGANCSAYAANAWWLPMAYVNNATCACTTTPNSTTANCVRGFLQVRLAATPGWLKALAATQKIYDIPASPLLYTQYQAFVQAFLTPRIYRDHVDAYRSCCCPSGPAPYPAWVGVTSVGLPCSMVDIAIRLFGSCHGTPGRW